MYLLNMNIQTGGEDTPARAGCLDNPFSRTKETDRTQSALTTNDILG